MRRLAENVLVSTKEIKGLIGEIREATDSAIEASHKNRSAADDGNKQGTAAMSSVQEIVAGVQEASWTMLKAAEATPALAAQLRAIHLQTLRDNARRHAVQLAA